MKRKRSTQVATKQPPAKKQKLNHEAPNSSVSLSIVNVGTDCLLRIFEFISRKEDMSAWSIACKRILSRAAMYRSLYIKPVNDIFTKFGEDMEWTQSHIISMMGSEDYAELLENHSTMTTHQSHQEWN